MLAETTESVWTQRQNPVPVNSNPFCFLSACYLLNNLVVRLDQLLEDLLQFLRHLQEFRSTLGNFQ